MPPPAHFLAAPKFVLTFFSLESSLSSPAAAAAAFPAAPGAFFFFDAPDAFPVADVGVGAPDPTSLFPPPPPRNDVDIGVGASEPPGVEFDEAGVWASCVVSNANPSSAPTNKARKPNQAIGGDGGEGGHTLLALYDTELREKTRFVSVSPVLRRAAAALPVPLV